MDVSSENDTKKIVECSLLMERFFSSKFLFLFLGYFFWILILGRFLTSHSLGLSLSVTHTHTQCNVSYHQRERERTKTEKEKLMVFSILQARNSARILISGSLSLFSNRYGMLLTSLPVINFISSSAISGSLKNTLFPLVDFSNLGCRRLGVQPSKWKFLNLDKHVSSHGCWNL